MSDAKVTFAHDEFPFGPNGFSVEMWEPFVAFVESSYPADADLMYDDGRSASRHDPESVRLWEQHVADYVASEAAG